MTIDRKKVMIVGGVSAVAGLAAVGIAASNPVMCTLMLKCISTTPAWAALYNGTLVSSASALASGLFVNSRLYQKLENWCVGTQVDALEHNVRDLEQDPDNIVASGNHIINNLPSL